MNEKSRKAGSLPAKTDSPALNNNIDFLDINLFDVPDTWPGDLDAPKAPELKRR